jgi:hypothetical protein
MRTRATVTAVAAMLAAGMLALVATGAGVSTGGTGLPRGSERVVLDPADFTTRIDNPYWPMRPGTRWVYRETDPDGTKLRDVVRVTDQVKSMANGVDARVVRDTATEDGALVEDTWDYYAQDRAGNVWYLGERTREYEDGKLVSTEGSFEAGVDGAQAGVVMPARPRPGLAYRQEHYPGHAEDRASIVSVREQAEVPARHYRHVLMTREVNPLEPRSLEFKFYARGVGPVLAIAVSGGSDREELVAFTRGK